MGRALAITSKTKRFMRRAPVSKIIIPSDSSIKDAAKILTNGGLVAFPTETVYGLGADATNEAAVDSIFKAKGRPSFNPLIVHVESADKAKTLVKWSAQADAIAKKFWAGAITIILPKSDNCPVSENVTAGLSTLAVRVPSHPVALELLKAANTPIAAPSANTSGHVSPTTPAHVANDLKDAAEMILAAGACKIGLESTVLDLSAKAPCILREGSITASDIADCLGVEVACHNKNSAQPKSPGLLLSHYAPKKPLRLRAVDLSDGEGLLAFGSTKFMNISPQTHVKNLSEDGDLSEAAANLFAHLRALDATDCKTIAAMDIPKIGIGHAINDRLLRASRD